MTNDKLNFVLAISSAVTGLATVAIAAFSVGTYRLFKLEKHKESANWIRLIAHLGRLTAETVAMLEVASVEVASGRIPDVRRMRARFKALASEAARSWEYAAALGVPRVLAHLHLAEVVIEDAEDCLNALEAEVSRPGGPDPSRVRNLVETDFVSVLRRCAAVTEAAFDSIPEKQRRLGGDGYHDLLDEAAKTAALAAPPPDPEAQSRNLVAP